MKNKTVALIIPHDEIYLMVFTKSFIKRLKKNYTVKIFKHPSVTSIEDSISIDLKISPVLLKFDLFFWFFHIFYVLRKTNQTSTLSFKIKVLKWYKKVIFQFFSSKYLSPLFLLIENSLPQNKIVIDILKKEKPDLLVCPGSAMDTYSHFFLRGSKELKIKSIMVISHWDYFTKKGIRFKPNKVLVWGKEMKKQAISMTSLKPHNIVIVGSPNFDRMPLYYNKSIKIRREKKISDHLHIMFAGTAIPYDESNILNNLDNLITKNSLKIKIFYKPHPRGWCRKESERNIFKNIIFFKKTRLNLKDYLFFDGLISPFSSMMLEFALFKKPSFGVFYNDKFNDWPLNEIINSKHIQPILKQKWFSYCIDEKKLESAFLKFIKIVMTVDEKIFKDLEKIIFYEKNSSIDYRIIKIIDSQLS